MRSDPEDFLLAHAIVDQFVVKAFRDQFQHLIALLLAGHFFVISLVHRGGRPHYFSFPVRVHSAGHSFMAGAC